MYTLYTGVRADEVSWNCGLTYIMPHMTCSLHVVRSRQYHVQLDSCQQVRDQQNGAQTLLENEN